MIAADFLADPYSAYRNLREGGPLHWDEGFCGGAWLLPNYADVVAVLRDPRFSTQRAGRWINGSGLTARTELREFKRIFARSLLFLNGTHHMRLRKVMHAEFKPAALDAMTPRIQAIVDGLLNRIEPSAEIDFMREFACQLPALVIADLLAIDAADSADFIAWSGDIAQFIGSPTPSLETARRAETSLVALKDYFRALLPTRRLHPGNDLVSQLIRAEASGGVITTNELLAQCCTLLFAGHETTRNLLGNGLFHLLGHPEQHQALLARPALMQSAIREFLRYDSPVQFTGRILTADIELHGRRLRRGQLVLPLIGAANRDPARFREPDVLDITRNEGSHLSFGYGPHVCIGAALTHMEAQIAFTSLLKRFPHPQHLASAPAWGINPVYRGLAKFPLRLRSPAQHANGIEVIEHF